jgi:hypothetical protein
VELRTSYYNLMFTSFFLPKKQWWVSSTPFGMPFYLPVQF